MNKNKKIRVFEAFAGYGGASFGLKKAFIPHIVVGFSEWDKWAIHLFQIFQKNHSDIPLFTATKLHNKICSQFLVLIESYHYIHKSDK